MLLGTYATIPMQDPAGGGAVGYMEFKLTADEKLLDKMPDTRQHIIRLIAQTAVDISEANDFPVEFLNFAPTSRTRLLTGLPEAMSFNPEDHR